MSLYYSGDGITLYHGDCLTEHREWLDADVLVTDPPYGIGWRQGTYTRNGTGHVGTGYPHDGIQNDETTEARDAVLSAWGKSKPVVAFGSFRAPAPADVKQTLVWQKPVDTGVVGSVTGYRTDTELIFLLGEHPRRNAERSSVLRSVGGQANYLRVGHPHAKPTSILEQLIEWLPGTIADPFAGSGSTLVAARNLGRKAIGVELEERYCEIVAKRLAQGALDFGDAS
jgi:DNA modification methylase